MSFVLDMVGLVVKDIPASVAFYQTLGLDINVAEDGGPYTEVKMENGLRLSLNHIDMIKEIDPHWVEPVGQRVGIAFLCDGPGDVDARYQRIVDAGYSGVKEPWDAFWGQRYAIVMDPDGTSIELFAPLGD